MDNRQAKYHGKILKFLPKAATVMNLPFSPNKEKRYSCAIVPMIPHEARLRRKSKNDDGSTENQEPTSPKISCMGQIKLKNKKVNMVLNKTKRVSCSPRDSKKQASAIKKMFSFNNHKSAAVIRSSASASATPSGGERESLADRPPSLSQMKRFASSRDRMASFDWTATQVAPVDAENRNIIFQDDDDVIIPFSAPMGVITCKKVEVALQPRKEINLWKRRTMTPPRPLDLNTMVIKAR